MGTARARRGVGCVDKWQHKTETGLRLRLVLFLTMVILISGISSGFGHATANALAAAGHIVYGTVRREVEHIPGVHYLYADVTDETAVEKAVNQLLEEQGRIDVFINNAGMGIGGPIEFTSTRDAHLQMETNFFGLVNFCRCILPAMRRQNSGRIIAISSIGGQIGLPFQGFYSASKYAIEGYCEALRLETSAFGIKVIVVNPGDFATGFTSARKKVDPEAAAAYPSYAASMQGIEKDENGGLKPQQLAKQICRIVQCRRPALQYTVASPLQKLATTAKTILPKRLFARIMALYYGV